jgi:hypothetical protein
MIRFQTEEEEMFWQMTFQSSITHAAGLRLTVSEACAFADAATLEVRERSTYLEGQRDEGEPPEDRPS